MNNTPIFMSYAQWHKNESWARQFHQLLTWLVELWVYFFPATRILAVLFMYIGEMSPNEPLHYPQSTSLYGYDANLRTNPNQQNYQGGAVLHGS